MEYITITSESYEKAVQEAISRYGDEVRIHSRREYTLGGGLFRKKKKKCELVCYLVKGSKAPQKKNETVSAQDLAEFEEEARTPDPDKLSQNERLDTLRPGEKIRQETKLSEAEKILDLNEIRWSLREAVLKDLKVGDDLELALSDRIISQLSIDHENQAHPKKYQVFLGPTGSGKTTTLAKIASLYQSVGKDVGIICLDSYRVGAYEQVKAFADAFGIPALLVKDEDGVLLAIDSFMEKNLVLVDTMGLSPNDLPLNLLLKGLLSVFPPSEVSYLLTCPANIKAEDMMKQYRHYTQSRKIDSLIVTKLDESESIGSFLTFAYEVKTPLAFCTNGQAVPDDLRKASTLVIMEYLKGFGMNIRPVMAQLS